VLTSFFTVPDDAELVVQYTNVFDAKESFWQKLLKRIGKLFKLFSGKREEKSDKELKDEKHEQEVKKVERDVLFSISIATSGLQKPAVSKLQSDLLNVYDKFLHE
jgi:ERCC4-related helicase